MRRWVKVTLAVIAGIAVLLALNAVTISNETQDAERTVEGAELIDTAKGEIQVLEEGDPAGDPVVLIHCYACSMRWYDEVAALLAAEHRVIRTDLLGHGGSAKPSGGYSIPDQAAAIAEVLGALDVRDATIVGHSLGGTIAAAVAEQSPDLAARVVNIDQAADDSFEDLSFLAELGYKPVVGQALKRFSDIAPSSVVRAEYEQAFAPGYNIASGFEDPDQVVEDFGAMTYTAYEEAAEAEGDFTDVRPLDDRLSALGIPVMVIFGTEDQIYDTDAAVQRFADIEGVRVELIEGAGHSPNVEVPDRVAALIAAFAAEPTPAEIAAAARKRAAAKRKAAAARRKAAAAKRKATAQKGAAKAGKTAKPAQ